MKRIVWRWTDGSVAFTRAPDDKVNEVVAKMRSTGLTPYMAGLDGKVLIGAAVAEKITLLGRFPELAAVIEEAEYQRAFREARDFREAWAWTTPAPTIDIDIAKARDIQEQRIKNAQRLKIRDILEREALGENVALEKANIRAVNPRALVDAAITTDELKAAMPVELL